MTLISAEVSGGLAPVGKSDDLACKAKSVCSSNVAVSRGSGQASPFGKKANQVATAKTKSWWVKKKYEYN